MTPNMTQQTTAENLARISWAEAALDAFVQLTFDSPDFVGLVEGDQEAAITDLVADLMHLAADLGFDARRLVRLGVEHFETENAESA